jgi:hypothetical protein
MKRAIQFAGLGLWIGAIGQLVFLGRLFRDHFSLITAISLVPCWTVFFVTFCNAPFPCSARTFRYILLFAMCWYASTSLLAEALVFGIQPASGDLISSIAGRVLMYLFGAVSFFVFIKASIIIRRHENEPGPADNNYIPPDASNNNNA